MIPPPDLRALTAVLSLCVMACAQTATPTLPPIDGGPSTLDGPVGRPDHAGSDTPSVDGGATADREGGVLIDATPEDIDQDSGPCEGARCREAVELSLTTGSTSVARLRDGTYVGWGANNNRILGSPGSDDFVNGPRAAPIVGGGRRLAVGFFFGCFYDLGAGARPPVCWGANNHAVFRTDRVGVDTSYRFAVEVPDVPGPIRSMTLGAAPHLCLVLEDSSFWCRGQNYQDGMGLGAQVETVPQFVRLPMFEPAARGPEQNRGGREIGVIRQDGTILLRGTSQNFELGDGVQSFETRTAVVRNVTGAVRFHSYSGGCARLSSGDVACWGTWVSPEGEIRPSAFNRPANGAAVVPWMRASTDECVGNAFVCGLFPGGRVRCAGANGHGQTGAGVQSDEAPPTDVPIPAVVTRIRCGSHHACGLTQDGAVYCWGDNVNGSAGQPRSREPVLRPTRVRWD